jgi:hypothetical protein
MMHYQIINYPNINNPIIFVVVLYDIIVSVVAGRTGWGGKCGDAAGRTVTTKRCGCGFCSSVSGQKVRNPDFRRRTVSMSGVGNQDFRHAVSM